MIDTALSADSFALVTRLVRDQCGLVLEPGKEYLVKSRLAPVATRRGFNRIEALVDQLRQTLDRQLVCEVVEALVTTETSFFRDVHPFETLKKDVLPKIIERRRATRQINIWCAASSSGQEPYSIALLIREYFPELLGWQVHLRATDVSTAMLDKARSGRYSQLEVNRGLPAPLLLKWFRQDGAHWEVDERVRSMITFGQLNLSQTWGSMPRWDLVFLRNVMIYFDESLKRSILGRVARQIDDLGYLILGGAETTLNLDDSFQRIAELRSGFYQLKGPQSSATRSGTNG